MEIHDLRQVNKLFLYGSLNGDIDKFLNDMSIRLPNKDGHNKPEHPKEIERRERLKERERHIGHTIGNGMARLKKKMQETRLKISDSVVIVNGDSGFGSKDIKFYMDKFEELNPILIKNNCYILFVRGGFDDPSIFENGTISLSNIKTIRDYSVVMLKNFNCLCIGGSVSFDRDWKKSQGERLGRKMYWPNENMVLKEDEIDKILDEYEIACVVTNTSPTFAYPSTNIMSSIPWASTDKTMAEDIQGERRKVDFIYAKFMQKNKKPYVWAYSSFFTDYSQITNDILFKSQERASLFDFNKRVMNTFNVNFDKKVPTNNCLVSDSTTTSFSDYLKKEYRMDGMDGEIGMEEMVIPQGYEVGHNINLDDLEAEAEDVDADAGGMLIEHIDHNEPRLLPEDGVYMHLLDDRQMVNQVIGRDNVIGYEQ